jgi:hypothetical protein
MFNVKYAYTMLVKRCKKIYGFYEFICGKACRKGREFLWKLFVTTWNYLIFTPDMRQFMRYCQQILRGEMEGLVLLLSGVSWSAKIWPNLL